ncbi:MAG: hypothetical protein REI64_10345 [Pedobacter sp.]|uniref:hypothetical protein n=1 Tax=Pedobacter sp. TaxID=1411316 RepID=UPI002809737F|nr:hypothetical protein [Pedobacter sp.]MDQ8005188.1 hypothetical protein [Pedobacter sp.]
MRKILGIALVFLLFTSCGKEENFVPDYPVTHNVTIVEFGITATNNVLLVPNKGVAGLMIVKTFNGYVAFDRCSTVNPEKACAVEPEDNGITAIDPCTGAKFLLLDGSPQKSPAKIALKRYSVAIAGGTIQVRN